MVDYHPENNYYDKEWVKFVALHCVFDSYLWENKHWLIDSTKATHSISYIGIHSMIVNKLTKQFFVTMSTGKVNGLPAELILCACCRTRPHFYESSDHL